MTEIDDGQRNGQGIAPYVKLLNVRLPPQDESLRLCGDYFSMILRKFQIFHITECIKKPQFERFVHVFSKIEKYDKN
jgi:hypothetical protein